MQYDQHSLSAAFPSMTEAAFADLVEDINSNGLIQPIVLFEDKVLDGWHRYRACTECRREPAFVQYQGNDPRQFVISANAHRRQLNPSQRAIAIAAVFEWKPVGRPDNCAPVLSFEGGEEINCAPVLNYSSEEEMAAQAGVSRRTIISAKNAIRAGEAVVNAVREGTITVKAAERISRLPEEEREAAIANPPKPVVKRAPGANQDVASLQERLTEAMNQIEDLIAELDAYDKAADGELIEENKRLRAQLRTVESQRDDYMRTCGELRREVASLQRKLGK